MADERMDLEAAGKLLGLHPNSVRARVKKGKIRHETDNTGKIWVFLDPEKVVPSPPTMKPSLNPTMEPSMNLQNQALVGVLEGHIETLKGENTALKSTINDLQRRLDLSEEERRQLTAALVEKQAVPAPPAVPERPSLFSRLWGAKKR